VNLDEFNAERFSASVAASNQGRALAVAGLAFVWLFASDFFLNKTKAHPSSLLAAAGAVLAFALLLDVAQLYIRWATLEYRFNKAEASPPAEHAANSADFVDIGPWPRRLTVPLFHAKLLCTIAGYVLLAIYLAVKLGG
jgi:formate hydrogenlyase subunit 3/multisubunit Na+/H+ antiporter MnhD subunit